MNRLQSEHPASLLPILHTASPWQFTCPADKMCLWWRDSFLSLAVHSLHSGGEICTTDSRWWVSDKLDAVKTVNALHRLSFDKMSPDLKFDLRKKKKSFAPFCFSPHHTDCAHCDAGILEGACRFKALIKEEQKNGRETKKHQKPSIDFSSAC